MYNQAAYQHNLANREKRKNEFREADTPVKDLRLYFTYEVPQEFHYLYNYAEVVGRILHQKQLLCPGYSHIYISIGETEEEAIARAIEAEDWYRFGIAVLSKEQLINTPVDQLESLLLKLISDGLHDLAKLDKLDTAKIDEAIRMAEKIGIEEQVLREGENRRYLFRITRKVMKKKKEEEIFFSLTDREERKEYKWKFGDLSFWDAAPWLYRIKVTNKLINTRPAPNTGLVLMGKKTHLELSVEKIKDGTGQLKLEDTSVPIDEKTLELSKMAEKIINRPRVDVSGMIFAAGLGTRFKPWTDKHPKALAVINGKSLLQRNVEYLQQYGVRYLVVNVHHFPDQIKKAVEENNAWGSEIEFSDETDELLETGGGLKKAFNELHANTVIIINSDILTDLPLDKMLSFHREKKSIATLAVTDRDTSRYFLFNEENILCGWRNTKTGEEKISRKAKSYIQKAFSGIHIIEKRIILSMQREGKFSMVDVYLDLAKKTDILAFDHTGSKFIDVGKPEAVAIAENLFI